MNRHHFLKIIAGLAALAGCRLLALEGAPPPHVFVPIVDPGWKPITKDHDLALRPGKGKISIFDQHGNFTKFGLYLDDLARNPGNVRTLLRYVMSDESGNWEQVDAPLYRGSSMHDQSSIHRMLRVVALYAKVVRENDVSEDFKRGLMTDDWRDAVEAAFRELINDDGLLALGRNTCDMAQAFHLINSGLHAAGLRPDHIWTLPHAQQLVRTLLTAPHIINPEDRWLSASASYLALCRDQNADFPDDPVLISGGKVFFTGGLFIGWKPNRPSLHGTWDGLSILNRLYGYFPEADPANSASIYYLWNQESREKKAMARTMIATLQNRLWNDWHAHHGATYCYVAGGQPVDFEKDQPNPARPSEAPGRLDHAGYPLTDFWHWSDLSYAEVFGSPPHGTNAGVQRLIANLGLKTER